MPCDIFNPHLPGEAGVDLLNLFWSRVHAILEVFSFYVNQFDYGLRSIPGALKLKKDGAIFIC